MGASGSRPTVRTSVFCVLLKSRAQTPADVGSEGHDVLVLVQEGMEDGAVGAVEGVAVVVVPLRYVLFVVQLDHRAHVHQFVYASQNSQPPLRGRVVFL